MNLRGKLFLLVWVVATGIVLAADPADSQVKGALMDIERYE